MLGDADGAGYRANAVNALLHLQYFSYSICSIVRELPAGIVEGGLCRALGKPAEWNDP